MTVPSHLAPSDQHWNNFSTLTTFANEAEVEHLLVSPLLEALHFERADVAQKVPVSFTSGTKRGRPFEADFVAYSGALHDRDTSLMVVEVKAPSVHLIDAKEQGESYAFHLRAPVLLVTNGVTLQVWQLQSSQESTLVLDIKVASLAQHRADLERVISKEALLRHAESLAFKKITPTADFLAYERAELARTQELAISRRLKTQSGDKVQSNNLLELFDAGALIIGPSGYGKTVLSRQLVTAAIKNRWRNPKSPVVAEIPLIDFAQSDEELVEFFFCRVKALQPEVTLASLKRSIQDCGAVIVCDGLEYVSQDSLPKVESRLRLFRRDFPKGQLFVFSRATVPSSFDLPSLTLERLNADERRVLVSTVVGNATLLWHMPKLLLELGEIPLLLRRIIDFFITHGTYPSQLKDLFENWISQLKDGLGGSPSTKARFEQALSTIARELAQRRLSTAEALTLIRSAGLKEETFDDLVKSGAVILTESSVGMVHDALSDYLRARELAILTYQDFQKALEELEIQGDSLLPVFLVSMTQDKRSRQLVWERLEALPMRRYIETIRFNTAVHQPFDKNNRDDVLAFLTEMADSIDAMLRGFFPALADVIRAAITQSLQPVKAVTLRGEIHLSDPPQFTYAIFPSPSGITEVVRATPDPKKNYRSISFQRTGVGIGDGRYMAAQVVREALRDVVEERTFSGGHLLANERALCRLRRLHCDYNWPLTPDESLSELLSKLTPHHNRVVQSWPHTPTGSAFTFQSIIDDVQSLMNVGYEKLDWWWLPFGSNGKSIYGDPVQTKEYLKAHYSRTTALYSEIVRTSFGCVATAFSYFNAMPFRWEVVVNKSFPINEYPSINWQWMPVEREADAEPMCWLEHEVPKGTFDLRLSGDRVLAELTRLGRSSGNYTLGGGGSAPTPDSISLNNESDAYDTSVMRSVVKMLLDDVNSLFADLPRNMIPLN